MYREILLWHAELHQRHTSFSIEYVWVFFFSSTVSLSKQEIISLCVANVRVYNRCVKSVHVKWPYFLAIYLHVFLRAVMELQWQVYCGFIKLLNYRSDFHTAGRDTLAELLGFARAEPGQFNSWSDEQSESRCWCSTEDFFWGFFFFLLRMKNIL